MFMLFSACVKSIPIVVCSASNTSDTSDVINIQSDSDAQEYRGTMTTIGGERESTFLTTLSQFTTSPFSQTSHHHSSTTVIIMVRPKAAFVSKVRIKGVFQILKGFFVLKEKREESQRGRHRKRRSDAEGRHNKRRDEAEEIVSGITNANPTSASASDNCKRIKASRRNAGTP